MKVSWDDYSKIKNMFQTTKQFFDHSPIPY